MMGLKRKKIMDEIAVRELIYKSTTQLGKDVSYLTDRVYDLKNEVRDLRVENETLIKLMQMNKT